MKVYGTPNLAVHTYKKLRGGRRRIVHLFTFNDKGEAVIDESKLSKQGLAKLKAQFKVEEHQDKVYNCKKCDYKTINKGELLAHYREHKKEE